MKSLSIRRIPFGFVTFYFKRGSPGYVLFSKLVFLDMVNCQELKAVFVNTSKAISILFIQGGGKGWYQVDRPIVASLEEILGEPFRLYDPELYWDESYQDYGWIWQIGVELSKIQNPVVLLGH